MISHASTKRSVSVARNLSRAIGKLLALIGALSLLVSVCTSVASAGSLRGTVSDPTHQPLSGVTIRLVGTQFGAISNRMGEFHIDHLPAGTYSVQARYVGYAPNAVPIVTITESGTSEVKLVLKEQAISSQEVVIQAHTDRESEINARLSEKEASNVINVLSAESIEHSPDQTSADALQRVSGLSLQRDQGEGRYVIFRGMDQRYNNTLLNGVKIPSPEPKVRFVPLDIIPSDLLARIEVTKALTPDMEADAIGGTANLVLRNAPEEALLNVSVASGYSQYLFQNQYVFWENAAIVPDPAQVNGPDYRVKATDFTRANLRYTPKQAPLDAAYSLTAGDRFFENSLGIVFSGSLQNTYRRAEGIVYDLKNDINNVIDNQIQPTYHSGEPRIYSTNRSRLGLYAKADYILGENQTIDFSYTYAQLTDIEQRHSVNELLDGERSRATLNIGDRSRYQQQKISSLLLSGSNVLAAPLSLKWAASFADASREQPDIAQLILDQNKDGNGNLDSVIAFGTMSRRWQHNDDKDYFARFDLEFVANPAILTLKTGGLYRRKSRNNYENDYTLNPDTSQGLQSQLWRGIDHASWTVYDNKGTSVYGYNNYDATEAVAATYLQANWTIDRLHILGGIRLEETQQGYTTAAPISLNATSASLSYLDLLPSIHFNYQLTDEQNLRLSVTRSISRPSYFELVPYSIQGDQYTEQGNYQLRRTKATNFDLRYEYWTCPKLLDTRIGCILGMHNQHEYGTQEQVRRDV